MCLKNCGSHVVNLFFGELENLSFRNWFWLVREVCEQSVKVEVRTGFIGDCENGFL
jgi:hypothetical protein